VKSSILIPGWKPEKAGLSPGTVDIKINKNTKKVFIYHYALIEKFSLSSLLKKEGECRRLPLRPVGRNTFAPKVKCIARDTEIIPENRTT
jgi:hypothetical protein